MENKNHEIRLKIIIARPRNKKFKEIQELIIEKLLFQQ